VPRCGACALAGRGRALERGNDGPVEGCGPDNVYLIQYTSGATVTAGSAAHNVRAARTAYALHPGSVVVSWLPLYHDDCGLMFLLLTVVAGHVRAGVPRRLRPARSRASGWSSSRSSERRARPCRRSRCRWFSGAAARRSRSLSLLQTLAQGWQDVVTGARAAQDGRRPPPSLLPCSDERRHVRRADGMPIFFIGNGRRTRHDF
jgi:hypothetical protein